MTFVTFSQIAGVGSSPTSRVLEEWEFVDRYEFSGETTSLTFNNIFPSNDYEYRCRFLASHHTTTSYQINFQLIFDGGTLSAGSNNTRYAAYAWNTSTMTGGAGSATTTFGTNGTNQSNQPIYLDFNVVNTEVTDSDTPLAYGTWVAPSKGSSTGQGAFSFGVNGAALTSGEFFTGLVIQSSAGNLGTTYVPGGIGYLEVYRKLKPSKTQDAS